MGFFQTDNNRRHELDSNSDCPSRRRAPPDTQICSNQLTKGFFKYGLFSSKAVALAAMHYLLFKFQLKLVQTQRLSQSVAVKIEKSPIICLNQALVSKEISTRRLFLISVKRMSGKISVIFFSIRSLVRRIECHKNCLKEDQTFFRTSKSPHPLLFPHLVLFKTFSLSLSLSLSQYLNFLQLISFCLILKFLSLSIYLSPTISSKTYQKLLQLAVTQRVALTNNSIGIRTQNHQTAPNNGPNISLSQLTKDSNYVSFTTTFSLFFLPTQTLSVGLFTSNCLPSIITLFIFLHLFVSYITLISVSVSLSHFFSSYAFIISFLFSFLLCPLVRTGRFRTLFVHFGRFEKQLKLERK